nr:MAG TPA: DNA-directed RNA polymerase subunit alpha [Caudoviricetes sp.]
MVSLDDLKNLIIYKKQFYLPINEKNKKKNSLIMLLTPNYKSSANMMTMPYMKNLKYFESYYMEKNMFMYVKNNDTLNENVCIIPESDYADSIISITEDYNDGKYMTKSYVNYNGDNRSIYIIKKNLTLQYIVDSFESYYERFSGLNIMCGDDKVYINTYDKTLYLPSLKYFNSKKLNISYDAFVRTMLHVYIMNCINQDLNNNISYPIGLVMANAYNDADIKQYDVLLAIRDILKHDNGIKPTIYREIQNNDYGKFIATLLKSVTTVSLNSLKASFSKLQAIDWFILKENCINLIKEDDEDVTPIATVDDLNRIGSNSKKDLQSLRKRLNRSSVYRLNKIKKDVRRGNVGKDSKGLNDIEKIQQGNIVSNSISVPETNSTVDGNVQESFSRSYLESLDNTFSYGDYVYLFEADNYDNIFKKALYKTRFKSNREVLDIYKNIKANLPFIKYTFLDISRYQDKNLFFDLSYYNESFFKNVSLQMKMNTGRGLNTIRPYKAYAEFLKRLVKDSRFNSYKKKTIFIPVLDWRHNNSTKMWIYKEDINPISYIYELIRLKDIKTLKSIFGDSDLLFLGDQNYFKLNISELEKMDASKLNRVKTMFITLINRIIHLGTTNTVDDDPVDDNAQESKKGIALNIINKVEIAKNVEINDVSNISDTDNDEKSTKQEKLDNGIKTQSTNMPLVKDIRKQNVVSSINKSTTSETSDKDTSTAVIKDDNVEKINKNLNNLKSDIVKKIAKASSNVTDISFAMDKLNDDEFKQMIEDVESKSEDNVDKEKSQSSKYTQTNDEFYKTKVSDKSVEELLKADNVDTKIEQTKLKVASINEDWKNMTFMNFDKKYDPDTDIVKMLDSMKDWKYPIFIDNIEVTDVSNSEDAIYNWKISCKDFKKTKFTLSIDVPKFVNGNFLLLRGNKKNIMIQSTLIPLIKTNTDECQIIGIGGYNKIFVRKYGNFIGKSLPSSNKFIKSIEKYANMNDNINIIYGDNSEISKSYELPLDYIDIGVRFSRIEIKNKHITIIFNQDELRSEVECDDSKGLPFGYIKNGKDKEVLYWNYNKNEMFSIYLIELLVEYLGKDYEELCDSIIVSGVRYSYSQASILNTKMPVILICSYLEGLIKTLKKAGIEYEFLQTLNKTGLKYSLEKDFIRFSDGYLVYKNTYSSSLLMNGLKDCDTENYSINDINNKAMYLDFIDDFGGVLKADGLENSYDCMLDPITKEILKFYNLPTDYVSVLIHASNLLADNKFTSHTDQSVRRWRRKELIAGYFYKAISTGYQTYANSMRHNRKGVKLEVKQSAIIDMLLSKDQAVTELSINNVINDVESRNTVTNKGLVGMNTDRAYSVDKRTYDSSMLNVLGMDTGFSGNVGINRQATMDANIEGNRGFIKSINGNTEKFSTAKTLTATEGSVPLGVTHDDPQRSLMTYIQTSKHTVRCENNDPMLITNGSDEAFAYMASDIFAFKAKGKGVITELVRNGKPFNRGDYMVITYDNGKSEFISLEETVEKNSDGGYNVPLQLDTDLKLGSKVVENTIVAYDKKSFSNSIGESKNLALTSGTLAKVAILNTDEGYEDSAAMTEEFGEKLGTAVIVDKEVVLDKGSNIFIYKKIGDEVIEGETIMSYQEDFDDDAVNRLMKNLSMDKEGISELGNNKITSKHSGIICDIKVYRTVELSELSDSLRKFVSKYESELNKTKKLYDKYNIDSTGLQSAGKAINTGKTKNVKDGVKIIFYIKYIDNMSIGDKITFYSANKGVIKYLIPKGQEPTSTFRPTEHIDTFSSMGSINARMTCSIPIVCAINKLMVELDRSVKDIAGIPYDVNKI